VRDIATRAHERAVKQNRLGRRGQREKELFVLRAQHVKTLFRTLEQLAAAINKALEDPAILKRLQDAGVDPTPGSTPEKLAEFIRAELGKWAPIIRASGAHVD